MAEQQNNQHNRPGGNRGPRPGFGRRPARPTGPRRDINAPSMGKYQGSQNDQTEQSSLTKRARSRNRFGARRPRLASERKLPSTQLHHGKIGAPEGITADMEDSTLKFYALGGLGEVGRNMYVLEYKDEIILIDAGILFPQDNMPGIDFIVPDTTSLQGKKDNIKALILTHGHMDHIGAIPYIIEKLGNPDIYTGLLTEKFVLKRQSEFPNLPKLNIELVKPGDVHKFGQYFTVEFFNMNHNIPDDLGLFISTPVGNVVHTADFKFDPNPLYGEAANYPLLEELGKRGVHTLICESTDAEEKGHSISETTVYENMDIIFKEATGMLVFGTFSSMINRMQQIVKLSEKYGRKVIFDGYSLKTNVEIAKEIGYLKIDKGTQIPIEQVDQYPRDRITILATGALGQEAASLMRIVNQEHRHLSINKGDSVVFSSSVIPGNERSVQYLKDMLYRAGVRVYHYQMMDLHAGGHAKEEDLIKIIELLKPKHLIPHHGHYSMMVTLGDIGKAHGVPEEGIIISDNGKVVHLTPDGWWFDKKNIPTNYIMVDGLGIGDVGNVVLRDRQVLAEDGMMTIITVVDPRTGQIRNSPDIISRGFIYLKENKDLLSQVRKRIRHIIESEKQRPMNLVYLKDNIREEIGRFLFQKTERRPMVLPVIIEV